MQWLLAEHLVAVVLKPQRHVRYRIQAQTLPLSVHRPPDAELLTLDAVERQIGEPPEIQLGLLQGQRRHGLDHRRLERLERPRLDTHLDLVVDVSDSIAETFDRGSPAIPQRLFLEDEMLPRGGEQDEVAITPEIRDTSDARLLVPVAARRRTLDPVLRDQLRVDLDGIDVFGDRLQPVEEVSGAGVHKVRDALDESVDAVCFVPESHAPPREDKQYSKARPRLTSSTPLIPVQGRMWPPSESLLLDSAIVLELPSTQGRLTQPAFQHLVETAGQQVSSLSQ